MTPLGVKEFCRHEMSLEWRIRINSCKLINMLTDFYNYDSLAFKCFKECLDRSEMPGTKRE